jgi:acyl-CoA reductase-like NAD-dependent aldehyde dehydrogenase
VCQDAKVAQKAWAKRSAHDRAVCIQRFRDLLDANAQELAKLMSSEMGKPVHQAAGEIKVPVALRPALQVGAG